MDCTIDGASLGPKPSSPQMPLGIESSLNAFVPHPDRESFFKGFLYLLLCVQVASCVFSS